MKKLFVLLIAILSIVSCKKETKDYVTLSGHFDNIQETDTVLLVRALAFSKTIKINAEGNFKDTIKLKKATNYILNVGRTKRFTAFLKNGFDIKITADANDFDNTIKFSGPGSESNNYLIERIKILNDFNKGNAKLMESDSAEFNLKINTFETQIKDLLSNTKGIDSLILSQETKSLNGYIKGLKERYKKQHILLTTLGKGKPSPKFTNYENFKGGKTSLDDFKGKYVYIDVWATWCRPCLGQIPALKELEKEYHGKNIEFVSISSDKPEKHQAWINMIKSKDMGGTQLFAGKDLDFMRAYQINSIPRFIFIGKNGEILNANAPRPSQKEAVKAMFEENGLK
jgi:thiol-disulfide isomerase/thioredoxin